jgi:hypothetical protein
LRTIGPKLLLAWRIWWSPVRRLPDILGLSTLSTLTQGLGPSATRPGKQLPSGVTALDHQPPFDQQSWSMVVCPCTELGFAGR